MSKILEFLLGHPTAKGLTVQWVLNATDEELEDRHDWVQWAFPTEEASAFVDAPTTTSKEMFHLPREARANLVHMFWRYQDFLSRTTVWRREHDHNHLRITRILKSLRLAGCDSLARDLYTYVTTNSKANEVTRRFWSDAVKP